MYTLSILRTPHGEKRSKPSKGELYVNWKRRQLRRQDCSEEAVLRPSEDETPGEKILERALFD